MKNFILRTAISLFFIGLLFYLVRDKLPEIIHVLKHANWALLTVAFALLASTVFVMAVRLRMIFKVENVSVRLSDASNLTFVGYFFNNFLPTSVGGDIVKAMCASHITGEAVKSVSSVLMDRIFGLFTFVLIPSVSCLFVLKKLNNPMVPAAIYALLALSFFFFLLLFNQSIARLFGFLRHLLNYLRLLEKAKKVYDRLHNFKNHRWVILKAMGLSLFGQSIGIFVMYLIAVSLGAETRLLYFFLWVPIIQLMSMLPSLGGLGIREGGYVLFLSPYIGKEYAFALGILGFGFLLLLSVVGGVIYLLRPDYHIRFKKNTEVAL